MTNFADLLNAPVIGSKPQVISEEHNVDNIDISTEAAKDAESVAASNRISSWDTSEYGVSRARAVELSKTEEGRAELRRRAQQRANLNISSSGKVAMFSANEVPWHGLGVTVRGTLNGEQALNVASLAGWNLQKVPLYANLDELKNPGIGVSGYTEANAYAVVRGDTGKVLGTVGKVYKIFSNEESFDFMDAVIEFGAEYETAGALGNGEKVWLLAKMPNDAKVVDGDTLENYVMFATCHDGTGAIKVFPTSIRTVCQNTYRQALGKNGRALNMRHTRSIKSNITKAKELLGLTAQKQIDFANLAKELASVQLPSPVAYFESVIDDITENSMVAGERVTKEKLDAGVIDHAISMLAKKEDKDAAYKQLRRIEKRREEIMGDILQRYESERCNGMKDIAGSAWAAVNAITEFSNHSSLIRYKGSNKTRQENRFSSILDGKAYDLQTNAMNKVAEFAN